MNPFRRGINNFFKDINFLIVLISLAIAYFAGVGLTCFFAKLFNKHFLETHKKDDYWSSLNLREKPMEEYFKQY